jgi:hypothetical protein
MSEGSDPDPTPEQVEEGDAQRSLGHEDPESERKRAGLGAEEGSATEPLPDERRDEA